MLDINYQFFITRKKYVVGTHYSHSWLIEIVVGHALKVQFLKLTAGTIGMKFRKTNIATPVKISLVFILVG